MDYIDSVSSIQKKNNFIMKFFLKKRLEHHYRDYLESCIKEIDNIIDWIDENEKQIQEWEKRDSSKFMNLIRKHKALNKFLEANCQLLFLESDLRTAAHFMTLTDSDWEYRFFARRAYSLLCAANETFSKVGGEFKNQYQDIFQPQALQRYTKAKGQLDRFFKGNLSEFKSIRNVNEAHKSRDLKKQQISIKQMSVKKSWNLITESLLMFQNLNYAIYNIHKSLLKPLHSLDFH